MGGEDTDSVDRLSRPGPLLLWDLPTRVFHWSLVILVPVAWASAEWQYYEVHQWAGYTVLCLVGFRLLWGLFGSRHSRFVDFLVGPRRLWAYVRGRAAAGPGHNPLGGLSVVAFLVVLFAQAVSGLFNTDEILYTGPLYYAADKDMRTLFGQIHDWGFNVLLGLIGLHLAAISFYQFLRGKRMIQAMVFGRARNREGRAPAASTWLALAALLVVACILAWVLSLAPLPPPPLWGWI